jgi:deoxyadenosine/deoxycytidine kinase
MESTSGLHVAHPSTTFVSLEGNIGSGKSTLLASVGRATVEGGGIRILQEPVEEWSKPYSDQGLGMLQLYYSDPRANGFAFQMFVLLSRIRQQLDVLRDARGIVLTERCMASDFELFGKPMRKSGLMDDAQWTTYREWSRTMHCLLAPGRPAGIVYLRVSPSKSVERIRSRHRDGEEKIDLPYIEMLHLAHEEWIHCLMSDGVPVLILDGEQDGDAAIDAHTTAIIAFIAKLTVVGSNTGLVSDKSTDATM